MQPVGLFGCQSSTHNSRRALREVHKLVLNEQRAGLAAIPTVGNPVYIVRTDLPRVDLLFREPSVDALDESGFAQLVWLCGPAALLAGKLLSPEY
jgi:hypothetical protein